MVEDLQGAKNPNQLLIVHPTTSATLINPSPDSPIVATPPAWKRIELSK